MPTHEGNPLLCIDRGEENSSYDMLRLEWLGLEMS